MKWNDKIYEFCRLSQLSKLIQVADPAPTQVPAQIVHQTWSVNEIQQEENEMLKDTQHEPNRWGEILKKLSIGDFFL